MISEMKKLLKKIDYCSGVPDFQHIRPCCKLHDEDYKNQIGKFKADYKFFRCGWSSAIRYYPSSDTLASSAKALSKRVWAKSVAVIYYFGVSLFGWAPYYRAGKKHG